MENFEKKGDSAESLCVWAESIPDEDSSDNEMVIKA